MVDKKVNFRPAKPKHTFVMGMMNVATKEFVPFGAIKKEDEPSIREAIRRAKSM